MTRFTALTLLGSLFAAGCGQATVGTPGNTAAGSTPDVAAAPTVMTPAPTAPLPRTRATSDIDTADNGSALADHAAVNASLKRELVGTAKLDGQPITNVTMRTRCSTVFATRTGAVTVNWAKVGNFAGDIGDGIATLPITDDGGDHKFTMPDGAGFRRIDGSMGLLSDDCQS